MQLPKGRSLRANFSWSLIGNAAYAGSQWIMLMLLAKLCAAESVGVFALALAISMPVLMLTGLQLRAVQAVDAQGEHRFCEYLGVRLAGTALAFVIICVAALMSGPGRTAAVIAVIGAAKCIEQISDMTYGLFQVHELLDLSAISMALRGGLSLIAFGGALLLTRDLLTASIALCCAFAVVLIAWDLRRAALLAGGLAALRPTLSRARSVQIVRRALPLGLVMLMGGLSFNLPRYFLERERGLAELGVFAALCSAIVAGNTVVGALGHAAAPRLARMFTAGDREGYLRLVWKLVAIGLGLGVCGVTVALVGGRPLLGLFFTRAYAARDGEFVLLMAVAGLSYVAAFLGYAITAARAFAAQAPLSAAVSATTLLACFFLIPRHGVGGAALALGAGFVVQAAGELLICTRAVAALMAREAAT